MKKRFTKSLDTHRSRDLGVHAFLRPRFFARFSFVTLKGELSEENRQRLLQIADRCPVHRTLHGDLKIKTQSA